MIQQSWPTMPWPDGTASVVSGSGTVPHEAELSYETADGPTTRRREYGNQAALGPVFVTARSTMTIWDPAGGGRFMLLTPSTRAVALGSIATTAASQLSPMSQG